MANSYSDRQTVRQTVMPLHYYTLFSPLKRTVLIWVLENSIQLKLKTGGPRSPRLLRRAESEAAGSAVSAASSSCTGPNFGCCTFHNSAIPFVHLSLGTQLPQCALAECQQAATQKPTLKDWAELGKRQPRSEKSSSYCQRLPEGKRQEAVGTYVTYALFQQPAS